MRSRKRLGRNLMVVGAVLAAIGIAGLVWPSDDEPAAVTSEPAEASPSPSLPSEEKAVESFVVALYEAIKVGDAGFLLDSLDSEVTDFYGVPACRQHVAEFSDPDLSVEVVRVADPAPWDWEVDGTSTEIPDAIEVTIRRTTGGETDRVPIHVGSSDGYTWFTDCGEPRA